MNRAATPLKEWRNLVWGRLSMERGPRNKCTRKEIQEGN